MSQPARPASGTTKSPKDPQGADTGATHIRIAAKPIGSDISGKAKAPAFNYGIDTLAEELDGKIELQNTRLRISNVQLGPVIVRAHKETARDTAQAVKSVPRNLTIPVSYVMVLVALFAWDMT